MSLDTSKAVADMPQALDVNTKKLLGYLQTIGISTRQVQVKKFTHGQSNPTSLILLDDNRYVPYSIRPFIPRTRAPL